MKSAMYSELDEEGKGSCEAAGYPPVSVNITGPVTDKKTAECFVMVLVEVMVVSLAGGMTIGHFIWKPVPHQCQQEVSTLVQPSNKSRVVRDLGKYSEVENEQKGVSALNGRASSQCHINICYLSKRPPTLSFSTRDVEYYEETGLNLEAYNTLLITVKICHNAYVGLLTESDYDMVEIVIGGHTNGNLVGIRSCHECYLPDQADVEYAPLEISPLTDCDKHRKFWIHWDAEKVMLGRSHDLFEDLLIVRANPLGWIKPKRLALNSGFWATTGHWLVSYMSA